jgi:hypothetical protein
MSKLRRALRVFFNTYYEDDANRAIEAIREIVGDIGKIDVKRSSIVGELYYVEILLQDNVDKDSAEKMRERIINTLKALSDTIFGVKAYISGFES